jgi:hypothetical protein
LLALQGYLESEMQKDDITIDNDGDNPKAPTSREIVDVEVSFHFRV